MSVIDTVDPMARVFADPRTPGERIAPDVWTAMTDGERAHHARNHFTPEEWRQAEIKLSRAIVQLLVFFPFFGSMVAAMSMDRVWIDGEPELPDGSPFHTMATDGRRLYLWPPFVLYSEEKFLLAILMHELFHNILHHPARSMGYEPELANQAMDYAVNLLVNDAAIQSAGLAEGTRMTPSLYGTVPWYVPVNSALHLPGQEPVFEFCVDERFRDEHGNPLLWERIYAILDAERQDGGGGGRVTVDSHGAWRPGNRPADGDGGRNAQPYDPDLVRRWAQAAAALVDGDFAGSVPAGFRRRIEQWLNPPLPWHRLMQAFLKTAPGDFAWAPGDLRFAEPMPSYAEQPQLTYVTLGFDLSGSMDDREVAACVAQAKSLLTSFPGTKGRAYFWDAAVHQRCDLEDFDGTVERDLAGGGGTRIAPQFAAILEDGIAPQVAVHVCFTDGFVNWNEIDPETLTHDVLWVITDERNEPPAHRRYRWTRLETT